MSPTKFNSDLVIQQLRYNGLLETVKVRSYGYNIRIEYAEFTRRFGGLGFRPDWTRGRFEQHMTAISARLPVQCHGEIVLGKTKVFMRQAAELDLRELLFENVTAKAVLIQGWWRRVKPVARFRGVVGEIMAVLERQRLLLRKMEEAKAQAAEHRRMEHEAAKRLEEEMQHAKERADAAKKEEDMARKAAEAAEKRKSGSLLDMHAKATRASIVQKNEVKRLDVLRRQSERLAGMRQEQAQQEHEKMKRLALKMKRVIEDGQPLEGLSKYVDRPEVLLVEGTVVPSWGSHVDVTKSTLHFFINFFESWWGPDTKIVPAGEDALLVPLVKAFRKNVMLNPDSPFHNFQSLKDLLVQFIRYSVRNNGRGTQQMEKMQLLYERLRDMCEEGLRLRDKGVGVFDLLKQEVEASPSKHKLSGKKKKRVSKRDKEVQLLNGHKFADSSFGIPTQCAITGKRLWGVNMGYICKHCKMAVAHSVIEGPSSRLTNCPGASYKPKVKGKHRSGRGPRQAPSGGESGLMSLLDQVAFDRSTCANQDMRVPLVVDASFHQIAQTGLHVEGIYRKTGNIKRGKELVDLLTKGSKPDLGDENVLTIGNMVKKYLRDVPSPVFPFEIYDGMVRIADYKDDQSKVSTLFEYIDSLPDVHRAVLQSVCEHLYWVSENAADNLMNIKNLSVVFGPTILRCENTPANMARTMEDRNKVNEVIELLLDKYTRQVNASFDMAGHLERAVSIMTDLAYKEKKAAAELHEACVESLHVLAKQRFSLHERFADADLKCVTKAKEFSRRFSLPDIDEDGSVAV